MHNQTQDSLSIQSRSRGQAIPEPPPEGVQRGGDKTCRMDASTLAALRQSDEQEEGDEAHTGGIVRGGNEAEESPPVGILRG